MKSQVTELLELYDLEESSHSKIREIEDRLIKIVFNSLIKTDSNAANCISDILIDRHLGKLKLVVRFRNLDVLPSIEDGLVSKFEGLGFTSIDFLLENNHA